jgi:hypothetical protein
MRHRALIRSGLAKNLHMFLRSQKPFYSRSGFKMGLLKLAHAVRLDIETTEKWRLRQQLKTALNQLKRRGLVKYWRVENDIYHMYGDKISETKLLQAVKPVKPELPEGKTKPSQKKPKSEIESLVDIFEKYWLGFAQKYSHVDAHSPLNRQSYQKVAKLTRDFFKENYKRLGNKPFGIGFSKITATEVARLLCDSFEELTADHKLNEAHAGFMVQEKHWQNFEAWLVKQEYMVPIGSIHPRILAEGEREKARERFEAEQKRWQAILKEAGVPDDIEMPDLYYPQEEHEAEDGKPLIPLPFEKYWQYIEVDEIDKKYWQRIRKVLKSKYSDK